MQGFRLSNIPLRLFVALVLLVVPIVFVLMGAILQVEVPDWLQYILFALLVPAVVQIIRFLAAKGVSVKIRGWVARGLALVLSVGAIYAIGGFTGLAPPAYSGDIGAFIGPFLAFLVKAWAPVEFMYRMVVAPLEGVGVLKV